MKCTYCDNKARCHRVYESKSDVLYLGCLRRLDGNPEYLVDCLHCELEIPIGQRRNMKRNNESGFIAVGVMLFALVGMIFAASEAHRQEVADKAIMEKR